MKFKFVSNKEGFSTFVIVWLPTPTSFTSLVQLCIAPTVPSTPVSSFFIIGSWSFHGLHLSKADKLLTFSHTVSIGELIVIDFSYLKSLGTNNATISKRKTNV